MTSESRRCSKTDRFFVKGVSWRPNKIYITISWLSYLNAIRHVVSSAFILPPYTYIIRSYSTLNSVATIMRERGVLGVFLPSRARLMWIVRPATRSVRPLNVNTTQYSLYFFGLCWNYRPALHYGGDCCALFLEKYYWLCYSIRWTQT